MPAKLAEYMQGTGMSTVLCSMRYDASIVPIAGQAGRQGSWSEGAEASAATSKARRARHKVPQACWSSGTLRSDAVIATMRLQQFVCWYMYQAYVLRIGLRPRTCCNLIGIAWPQRRAL